MRIIAGTYGGRVLKSPPDKRTRPTSDRLRETLFNILAPRINEQTRFLDLCAGTGAIGIEALSRGAAHVTFVDRSRRACALIEENLDSLHIPEEQTEVIALSAENYTGRNASVNERVDNNAPTREQSGRGIEHGWDIVFYDPPYDTDYTVVLLEFGLPESKLLNDDGVLIAEHHTKNELPDAIGHLRRWRILKQGETSLSFYERN